MKKIMITLIGLTIVGALNAGVVDLPADISAIKDKDFQLKYGPGGICNGLCRARGKNPNSPGCQACLKKAGLTPTHTGG